MEGPSHSPASPTHSWSSSGSSHPRTQMRREVVTPSLWPRGSHRTGHCRAQGGRGCLVSGGNKPGMAGPKGSQGSGQGTPTLCRRKAGTRFGRLPSHAGPGSPRPRRAWERGWLATCITPPCWSGRPSAWAPGERAPPPPAATKATAQTGVRVGPCVPKAQAWAPPCPAPAGDKPLVRPFREKNPYALTPQHCPWLCCPARPPGTGHPAY